MIKEFEILENVLKKLELTQENSILEDFSTYMDLTLAYNEKINLTAILEPGAFVMKHFVDSLMCASFSGVREASSIIDIGTGAGFPGIPLALVFPEKKFVLVDSLNKRIRFLEEVISDIGISNVTLIHSRAEDVGQDKEHREKYDVCVSRAVAKMSLLAEYCLPLVKKGGYFAAYKSLNIDEELEDSKAALHILGGEYKTISEFPLIDSEFPLIEYPQDHQIIYIEKIKNTPKKYPRKAGTPSRDPIK